jgi:small subunit ribosomal protein S6
MPNYETVFIARQELSDAQVKELTDNYCKILTDDGGKMGKVEHWGLRTLAYRINKSRKGHYVLFESDTSAASILEMERQMRLSDDVMRYMSIRIEALTEGPSAMMDKGGDRDKPYNKYDNKKPYEKKKEAA